MGCIWSSEERGEFDSVDGNGRTKKFVKPTKPWSSEEPIDAARLQRMREEFWETQPHYGGDKNIWDALKAAVEADIDTARLIVETAGIIVSSPDMTVTYDERGAKYELPLYLFTEPTNLIR